MSTKDKTRQKLVDSMRRTKASAQEKSGTDTETTVTKNTPVPETKTPVRQPAESRTTQKQVQTDPYQSARRIWPD